MIDTGFKTREARVLSPDTPEVLATLRASGEPPSGATRVPGFETALKVRVTHRDRRPMGWLRTDPMHVKRVS